MKINLKPLTDIISGDQKPKSNTNGEYHLKYLKEHYRNGARVFQVKVYYNAAVGDYKAEMPYDFIFESNDDLDTYKPKFVSNTESEENYNQTYLVREEILTRTVNQFNLEQNQIFQCSIQFIGDDYFLLEILLFVERFEDKNKPVLKEIFYTQYVANIISDLKELINQTITAHKNPEFRQKILSNTHNHLSKLFSEAFEWYQHYDRLRNPDAVNYCTICAEIGKLLKYLEHNYSLDLEGIEVFDEPFVLGLHNFDRNANGLVIAKWIEWENEMNKTEVFAAPQKPNAQENVLLNDFCVFNFNKSDNTKSYINMLESIKDAFKLEIQNNLEFEVFNFGLLKNYISTLNKVFTHQKEKILTYTPNRKNLIATYFTKEGAKFTGEIFKGIEDAPDYIQDNLHECLSAQYHFLNDLLEHNEEMQTLIDTEGQKPSTYFSYAPTIPAHFSSNHYKQHAFTIEMLLSKIQEIKEPSKRTSYMWEARNEYKRYFGDKPNAWGTNFAEQVEKEIEKNSTLESAPPPAIELKNENITEAIATTTFKKLKWNAQINILADIFYQLTYEIQKDGKKVLEAEKQEVVDFLCRNFTDKDGEELSPSSLATMLSTSRVEKRPKEHKRYNVQQHFLEK